MDPDLEAVERANASFYRVFAARDMPAMEALWAQREELTCIHPGWPLLVGRDAVLSSWRRLLEEGGAPETIRCLRPVVRVVGDAAWVLCTEDLGMGALVATNVFVREGRDWKMVHHQAGPTPPGVDEPEAGEGGSLH